ncbi:glycosyltransferase family 4 protein [Patescibacteria group bacterium]|nr:glycosyltransferase family 4 protein [Patescibacteria group bacterium]MBU1921714.1 glycosyltransferase family 4 protein [Patescibacteria group bacterium]
MDVATKKKLLYLITQPEWGGAQRYIFDLAISLKDRYDITVATGEIKNSQELLDRLKKNEIKTHVFPHLVREVRPLKDLQAFLQIFIYIKLNNFDAVHLNSSKAGVIGAIAANILGVKKIIYTAHGWVFNEPLPAWKKKFYKWAEKLSARHTTKIITLSKSDTEIGILENIAPAEKFVHIYHGIKKTQFLEKKPARQEINKKLNLTFGPDDLMGGCAANFYKTKGLDFLIKAWKQVQKKIPQAKLIIIGQGKLKKSLQAQIQKFNLENSVFLPGALPDSQKYLKAFDVFVLSSVKEGFPYVILEAMQARVPIIATHVGGIPEMLENEKSGLLVTPADPAGLTKKIILLLQNKKLGQRLADQAFHDLNAKFNFTVMLEKTSNLYIV